MRTFGLILLGTLMAISLAACDSDSSGGGSGGGSGVAGTWNGTGNYVHNNVPVTQFTLQLDQNGDAVTGTYAIKRDARGLMPGTVSGTVSGDGITMTMTPHGTATGTVSGNRMTLNWVETGFGGSDFAGPRNASVTLTR
ncbi:MAG: hypothetical protein PHO14_04555 [Kiritimatiellae bacterium]|nr:hypothetical protein [Kiritimatiellia bacterium]MDD4341489.1 hypothetical protein [Kiritimatiellia bacterium]